MRMLRLAVVVALVAAGLTHAPSASAAKPFYAALSGTNELPIGTGDPNGSGTASFLLKRKKHRLCWTITYERIDPPTAGHIHAGGPAAEGGIEILLFSTEIESGASDCVKVTKSQANDLLDDTANRFYVNLHNSEYPDGAIRGQLT